MSKIRKKEHECYIYVRQLPFDCDKNIYCNKKREDIEKTTDYKLKEQKFYAYKLLEFAICKHCNIDSRHLSLEKLASGKWVNKYCNFSISHSLNAVCVALSNINIGVDIEEYNPERYIKLKDKILCDAEKPLIQSGENLGEYLNQLWTKKEAVFKCKNDSVFIPNKIEAGKYFTYTKKITLDRDYYLSIAAEEKLDIIIE